MRSLALNLTAREADFIWQALRDFRYENYSQYPLDLNEVRHDFIAMSMEIQEQLKNMFPDVRREAPVDYRRNRTKYGRRRLRGLGKRATV